MFSYTKLECEQNGVMLYNVTLEEPIGPFTVGDIIPYVYLCFKTGFITFGTDFGDAETVDYNFKFNIFKK